MMRAIGMATWAVAAVAATPRIVAAHPLHTTFVELGSAPSNSTITATVKVFADDFIRRVTRGRTVKPGDEALLQKLSADYLAQTLLFRIPSGQVLQLRFCGWKRSADLIFICMSGVSKTGLAGLTIRDVILADVFTDQVNVLQAQYAGRRHSLLFVGGAGVKQLPAS
ncbi:MAG: hypothetical protein M3Z17_00545 [Gemmatimonadota bacterium]|nr:hypothetical protein [Gemmatimonadota bacterium]